LGNAESGKPKKGWSRGGVKGREMVIWTIWEKREKKKGAALKKARVTFRKARGCPKKKKKGRQWFKKQKTIGKKTKNTKTPEGPNQKGPKQGVADQGSKGKRPSPGKMNRWGIPKKEVNHLFWSLKGVLGGWGRKKGKKKNQVGRGDNVGKKKQNWAC